MSSNLVAIVSSKWPLAVPVPKTPSPKKTAEKLPKVAAKPKNQLGMRPVPISFDLEEAFDGPDDTVCEQ